MKGVNRNASDDPPHPESWWRTLALVLALVLLVCCLLWGGMYITGWRLQPPARPPSQPASAEVWSPPTPGESVGNRVKRLAHELASSFASTNRPDPGKVLNEGETLARSGHYEEALERYIWYHNHSLEYPGQGGVRLSFALSDWIALGRKFPKAMRALIEIRDRDVNKLAAGQGDFGLFQEVAAINGHLNTADATAEAFKALAKRDPKLAAQCYPLAEDSLVQRGDYGLCLRFLPDSQARFEAIRSFRENLTGTRFANAQMKRFANDQFVNQTRNLIEILVATGHEPEAERIRSQALAILNDPRLSSAITDAQERVGK